MASGHTSDLSSPATDAPPTGALSNEEVVRSLFDAFSRRDLQSAVELMHPGIVFQPMTAAVTRGGEPYRGHEGIRRYTEDVESHWEQLTIRLKQIRSAGRAVVALGLVSGSGCGRLVRGRPHHVGGEVQGRQGRARADLLRRALRHERAGGRGRLTGSPRSAPRCPARAPHSPEPSGRGNTLRG